MTEDEPRRSPDPDGADLSAAETRAGEGGGDPAPAPSAGEGSSASASEGASASGRDATRRYAARGTLGTGGMGVVERHFDRELGREVARKTLHRDQPVARERFLREARITGRLEHPGIVPVYDLGRDPDGRPFYTMRIVEGRTLAASLDDLRAGTSEPPLSSRIDVFLRACDAVAYAHSRGVIHRDLKPENIMTGPFGQVLVVDWGLARVIGDDGEATGDPIGPEAGHGRTLDGAILGTPAYMPPEQAEGRIQDVDERSDVYGLGAVLYELLTLERPYQGASAREVLTQVVRGELVPPRARAPGQPIPEGIEAAALRAMARKPSDRFDSVLALQQEVRRTTAAGRIRDEIQLRRIDPSAAYSCIIGMERSHALLARAYQELMAPWHIPPPEVNILRIMHGSRAEGVTFPEIYERLVWTDYGAGESVRHLIDLGYARAEGSGEGALYFATESGQDVAEATIALDGTIEQWGRSSGLSDDDWRTLSELLSRFRSGELARFQSWRPDAPGA